MAWKATLCPGGCGQPRQESFDPAMEDRYDIEVWQCHACAASQRKRWNRDAAREPGDEPPFGQFYIVKPEDGDP